MEKEEKPLDGKNSKLHPYGLFILTNKKQEKNVMNEGLKQLQALVKEKSVAEVAEKAELSRASLYYVLNHGRPAGKKIRENLFLAFGIPAEYWGFSAEPAPKAEPDTSDVPVLKIREGLQLKIGHCWDCILHDLPGCCSIVERLFEVECYTGYAIVKTGE